MEDGTWVVRVAPEQRDRYVEVVRRCGEEVGLLDPGAPRSLTEDQLRSLYEGYLDVATCLAELGYGVFEPPSVEAFVDSGSAVWSPWDAIVEHVDEAEWERIVEECPHP